jgi:hypothetical protein
MGWQGWALKDFSMEKKRLNGCLPDLLRRVYCAFVKWKGKWMPPRCILCRVQAVLDRVYPGQKIEQDHRGSGFPRRIRRPSKGYVRNHS